MITIPSRWTCRACSAKIDACWANPGAGRMSDSRPSGSEPAPASTQGRSVPSCRRLQSNDLETLTQLRHALRTPLNQIIGYSEMLMESIEDLQAERLLGDIKKVPHRRRPIAGPVQRRPGAWKMKRQDRSARNAPGYARPAQCHRRLQRALPEEAAELARRRSSAISSGSTRPATTSTACLKARSSPTRLMSRGSGRTGRFRPRRTGRAEPAQQADDASGVSRSGRRAYSGNLLVVDDDAMNRDMMARPAPTLGLQRHHGGKRPRGA